MLFEMDPLLRGAVALTLLGLLSRGAELRRPAASGDRTANAVQVTRAGARNEARPEDRADAPCPRWTLPDGNVCIPVPSPDALDRSTALDEERNEHHDRVGRLRVYDQIPRQPDRPADFRAYRLPVPVLADQSFVSSGYDLDRPDEEQRRGATLSSVGHGGVDLAQARGTAVRLVRLEQQVGEATVLAVGHLFGTTVVTEHTRREAGQLRQYLLVYGHLDNAAPNLVPGQSLAVGALLGYVGDSGSPGVVHLHLEVRRVREGVEANVLALGQVTQNAKTVACDPRNVLELRP